MNRRKFLHRTAPLPAAISLAGCGAPEDGTDDRNESESDSGAGSGGNVTGTAPIPMLEDPPDAVYLPGHRKSMRMLEPVAAGDYRLAPMVTYPHPFWLVTGTERQLVEPEAGRGVHLMLVVWDAVTGHVLPVDISPQATLEGDDGWQRRLSLWPMLSQEMGLHFGDNVTLPADGTYTVRVDLPPVTTRRTGALAGRFDDGATATFEFTYDSAFREAVVDGIELLERERWGERGALEPMTHGGDGDSGRHSEIPYSVLPSADAYPGTLLREADPEQRDGLPRSGDAVFVSRCSSRARDWPTATTGICSSRRGHRTTGCHFRTCRCRPLSTATARRSSTDSATSGRSTVNSASITGTHSRISSRAIR